LLHAGFLTAGDGLEEAVVAIDYLVEIPDPCFDQAASTLSGAIFSDDHMPIVPPFTPSSSASRCSFETPFDSGLVLDGSLVGFQVQ